MPDPYRTPHDDLHELRQSLRAALGAVTDRLGALPPSKLERLAKALAYFKAETDEPFEHPLEVLDALTHMAHEGSAPLWIDCSPILELENGRVIYQIGSKLSGEYAFPRALRIETADPRAHEIEFMVTGGNYGFTLIERCSITEFARMTNFEGTVISMTTPMHVEFFGPSGAKVRIIVRGERQPMMTLYPGMPMQSGGYGYISQPLPYPNRATCSKCGRLKVNGPGGCTCVTAHSPG